MSENESDVYNYLRVFIENQNQIKETLHDISLADQFDAKSTIGYVARISILEERDCRTTERLQNIENFQYALRLEERRGKSKLVLLVTTSVIGWLGVLFTHYLTK